MVTSAVLDYESNREVRTYIEKDSPVMALRRYHIVDGWHRVVALQRLKQENPDAPTIFPKVCFLYQLTVLNSTNSNYVNRRI